MTRISFSREPSRTTEVLGSFGQARTGGPPSLRSSGLMTSPLLFAFGCNEKIGLLRPLVLSGLIVIRSGCLRHRSEARAGSERRKYDFAPRWT